MNWSAYSPRHHFTATFLALPLIALCIFGGARPATDLYKVFGLAAVLVVLFYYWFLYKFDGMFAVSLIVFGLYLFLYFGYMVMGVVTRCSLFKSCGLLDYVIFEPFRAMAALGAMSVSAFLGLGLIWAYVKAGKRLGLSDK